MREQQVLEGMRESFHDAVLACHGDQLLILVTGGDVFGGALSPTKSYSLQPTDKQHSAISNRPLIQELKESHM